jgi:hypothetical protein
MRTRLTVATAVAGTLLATCLVSGSAQATSVPVLKGDATPGIVTLVGRGGGGGGKGHAGGGSRGGGGGKGHAGRGSGGGKGHARGGGGGRSHANRGGGKRHYGGGGKRHAYKGKHHRHGSYGRPYSSYGYGGGCGWLYRKARATGSRYWWNRYYSECAGYY